MAATILELEVKPDIIKKAIEYLKENDPMGERSLNDSNGIMSHRVGYQNAIRNLLKFVEDGGYNTDNYVEGFFRLGCNGKTRTTRHGTSITGEPNL